MADVPHNPLEGLKPELKFNLIDGTEENVSIIIVHKDRPEYLNLCLQSIVLNSFNSNYEIIVVDNNSGQETQEYLDVLEKDIKVVRNDKNLYWSAAANKGVSVANKNSKYLIFLHSDVVILKPNWMDLMINCAESGKTGLVGVQMNSYVMDGKKLDFIMEWCCLYTRECWDVIGPFPEELPMVGHSFIMTVRAQAKGFKAQMLKTDMCHHYAIFGMNHNDYVNFIDQAQAAIPKLYYDAVTK